MTRTSPSSELATLRLQAATVMTRLPTAHHISHHTAVRLWGGVAPDCAEVHVSMLTREDRCRRRGVAVHLAGDGATITSCQGLPLSAPGPGIPRPGPASVGA